MTHAPHSTVLDVHHLNLVLNGERVTRIDLSTFPFLVRMPSDDVTLRWMIYLRISRTEHRGASLPTQDATCLSQTCSATPKRETSLPGTGWEARLAIQSRQR